MKWTLLLVVGVFLLSACTDNFLVMKANESFATDCAPVLQCNRYGINVLGSGNFTVNVTVGANFSAKRPYGMFSSNVTQTIAVVNTSYNVSFNVVEDSYLVNKVADTNFTIGERGEYLIVISALFELTTAPGNKHVEIWMRKNGVDVPRSNTMTEIFNNGAEQVVAVPFIVELNPNKDNLQVMWASDSTAMTMKYVANTTHSPATPSIIMTFSKISEIT